MYNRTTIGSLISFIESHDGINDKDKLKKIIKDKFDLVLDRSVFYNESFSIRFSSSSTISFSNTVLSLSALQKYDSKPFIVCLVTKDKNYLMLANTSFLSKISHSSQELRVDNIKGSFNGGDILRRVDGVANSPENFEFLFSIHETFTFNENLERLVEKTTGIVGNKNRFEPTDSEMKNIQNSPERADLFIKSSFYIDLLNDLSSKALKYQTEISIAAFIENVNMRGRIIEYLITGDDREELKSKLIGSLHKSSPLPRLEISHGLGDYTKKFPGFSTETDIKTKVLFLDSNPKAYNIDKLLSFLAEEDSVYMIFFIGIDSSKNLKMILSSIFQSELLNGTVMLKHWAGRNSRGVTQFYGEIIKQMFFDFTNNVDIEKAKKFISEMINL